MDYMGVTVTKSQAATMRRLVENAPLLSDQGAGLDFDGHVELIIDDVTYVIDRRGKVVDRWETK